MLQMKVVLYWQIQKLQKLNLQYMSVLQIMQDNAYPLTNKKYHSMLPKLFLNTDQLQSFLLLMVTWQLNSDISQSLA